MYLSIITAPSNVDGRGGQLEIAGVVVGNWGANMEGGHRGRRAGRARGNNFMAPPPIVASVGPNR